MALVWVVEAVPAALPQEGLPDIDPSLSGEVVVVARVFDTGAPATVIHRQTFTFSSTLSNQQMQESITATFQKIKAARERRASLLPFVTNGTQIPMP